MSGLFCGIDIGSTNIKVLLMDGAGRTVWVRSVPAPRRHDAFGVVTEGRELVTALEELIIAGWHDVGRGKPLAAIASAGIGEDGFCVDDDLLPMGLAIPWFDKRDRQEAEELGTSAAARYFPAINFAFATTAAKWLWLSRHRPEEINRNATWVTLTDYPLVWWSGSAFISATLQPRTGIFDVFTRLFIPDLVEASRAPRLPKALDAGHIAGQVTRGSLLAAGAADARTLCVAGGHDHPVASSVILRLNAAARIDSIGTANAMFAETVQPKPGAATAGIDLSLPVRGGVGISALGPIEFSVPLLSAFGNEMIVRELLAVKRISGAPLARPLSVADAAATEAGVRLRYLLEALTWEALLFLRRMTAIGIAEGPIFATGGWAQSRALMELRASIFGESITIIHEPELTALGAALFAAEAVDGAVPNFMQFRNSRTIEPVADWVKVYADWG